MERPSGRESLSYPDTVFLNIFLKKLSITSSKELFGAQGNSLGWHVYDSKERV